MLISKTTFLEFKICRKNCWLKLHKPELRQTFALSDFDLHLVGQGNEVEASARTLWPGGVAVPVGGAEGFHETRRLMVSNVPAIFRATFVVDGFIAKCDVLVPGKSGTWDIYEVKATNSKKEGNEDRDHISDLAFQKLVLERTGVSVGRTFIVHLDRTYVREGALDVEALFIKDDSSEQVAERLAYIGSGMTAAKEYLTVETEPNGGCECHYKGRSRQCRTFAYSHPYVPEYSVHDLTKIGNSKRTLKHFVDQRILSLDDVPADIELNLPQLNQIRVHKAGRPLIDAEAIRDALGQFTYPLYFFDYETFAPAVPAFDRFSSYQRIPFQFSLHTLGEPGGVLEHVEYLHEELSDPTARVADLLANYIEPGGSVVVWHAPFERSVNSEIAERSPAVADIIERINGQLCDLEKIFTEQHYVHPGFRGRTSIKAILPVLCPQLSYDGLAIREGGMASNEWWRMMSRNTSPDEKREIAKALREYCALDTYAMYEIWKKLGEVAAQGDVVDLRLASST